MFPPSRATAFWLANLVISMTPVAAAYRSVLSIPYVPMLVEAAAGDLVVAGAVARILALGSASGWSRARERPDETVTAR